MAYNISIMANESEDARTSSTEIRTENASCMKPSDARSLFRGNGYSGYTSRFCSGYAQTNVLILPSELADNFEELCRKILAHFHSYIAVRQVKLVLPLLRLTQISGS